MRFRTGINYWPRKKAMRWWRAFDRSEVDQDFGRMARTGFDSVRVFLRWEDFQPAADHVSEEALENLIAVADTAGHYRLALMPTFFTGHMSGVNWIPRWALEEQPAPARFRVVSGETVVPAGLKNWYEDKSVIEAQTLLVRAVARELKDHPALWAYDLGNENSNCVIPRSRASGLAWLERMTSEIRSVDAAHPITIGLHAEDLEEDRMIGPREAARHCDFVCMHGYPCYSECTDDPCDAALLPYL